VDDYSRFTWVYLLKKKSDVKTVLPLFFKFILTQFHILIKCVQSDNGTEFMSLQSYFSSHDVHHRTSCVSTPQQNGVVERKHMDLLNTARALRFRASLPIKFWGECILTATFLINRLPSKSIHHLTPYEHFTPKLLIYIILEFLDVCVMHQL